MPWGSVLADIFGVARVSGAPCKLAGGRTMPSSFPTSLAIGSRIMAGPESGVLTIVYDEASTGAIHENEAARDRWDVYLGGIRPRPGDGRILKPGCARVEGTERSNGQAEFCRAEGRR